MSVCNTLAPLPLPPTPSQSSPPATPYPLVNHPNFFRESTVICIYKFCRKENLTQPSGEPRGQHLVEFKQRTLKLFDMDSISLFIN